MSSVNLGSSASSLETPDNDHLEIPIIDDIEPLADVVRKLYNYLTLTVSDVSFTFEQIGSTPHGHSLRLLINSLVESSHNTYIIPALMILKWQFDNAADYDWGVSETRGYACEYVAWQFVCHLNQRETIEYLLEELMWPAQKAINLAQAERGASGYASAVGDQIAPADDERAPLLLGSSSSLYRFFGGTRRIGSSLEDENQGTYDSSHDAYELEKFSLFFGLNALEIATIAHAKKFLSQKVVQRVIDHIWKGEIVFWDTLSVHSKKKPHFFNKRTADPYSRLRVPVYRKAFEAAFFVSFLVLYYAVLVERKATGIGIFETLMYFWIAAFAYDEVSGMADAGMLFYQMDFWKLWNMGIIGTGLAFVIARFLTTFTMLARDRLSLRQMSWILDIAHEISPIFGYGLMRRLGPDAENPPIIGMEFLVTSQEIMEADMRKSQANFRLDDELVTDLFFGQLNEHESRGGSGRTRKQPNPGPYPGAHGRNPGQAGSVDLAEMIDEVERLRTQVERVAATMAFHHRVQ
ncbi:hypothetical protein ETB97_006683 [Aspergillus alliaceus]|uniref:Calcium channel YVC1-like C-terminal transmembrane domain-containing protein n=1 Tax=Petromyces alliaceus TaxID=209559 RepID=A0A8H5ZXD9_PETAA|nr:hypothetical protein ETB97_006683 [Aspergillus burnettii]